MPEKSTAPDLAELMRRAIDADNRHDLDAVMGFFAPHAVIDMSDLGIGTFEGVAAIRSFIEEWWGTWGDHKIDLEELVDLGSGVMFTAVREDGRLMGSDGHVEHRRGWVFLWVRGMIERFTAYLDVDEARAAAERLARERG